MNVAKYRFAGAGGIILRVRVHTGRSIAAYSAVPDEAEILLSPNTRLTVNNPCTLNATDGYYYVDIEEDSNVFVF